jgi:hypothetical protein
VQGLRSLSPEQLNAPQTPSSYRNSAIFQLQTQQSIQPLAKSARYTPYSPCRGYTAHRTREFQFPRLYLLPFGLSEVIHEKSNTDVSGLFQSSDLQS